MYKVVQNFNSEGKNYIRDEIVQIDKKLAKVFVDRSLLKEIKKGDEK